MYITKPVNSALISHSNSDYPFLFNPEQKKMPSCFTLVSKVTFCAYTRSLKLYVFKDMGKAVNNMKNFHT